MHRECSKDKTNCCGPQLLLVGAALLWSLGGILIKMVDWNPVAIAGSRSAIAAILMLAIIKKPKLTWSFYQIGGALSYAGVVIFYVIANKMTTAANAILLQYTAPIYIALLSSWFLGEKASKLDWITIVIVLLGMVLFFMDDLSIGQMMGNIVAIISGICFALTILFLRKQKDESPLESVFIGNVVTALISVPFMFKSAPNQTGWLGIILLGVFQIGLSYVLYSKAIKKVTAMEGILIPIIEPVLNPVWVFIFMQEIPGTWSLIGGAIVVSSVTMRYIIQCKTLKV